MGNFPAFSQSVLDNAATTSNAYSSNGESALLAYNNQQNQSLCYGYGSGTANDEAADSLSFWVEDGGQAPSDPQKILAELQAATPAKRHRALRKLMNDQTRWMAFLAGLRSEDLSLIQAWLPAQCGSSRNDGDGPNSQPPSLDDQIASAHNSARGKDALLRIDQVMARDKNQPPRITPRLRELLALGVALPKLAPKRLPANADYLTEEGVLGAVQAERAAQALIEMPVPEYARTLVLIEQTGSRSADQQAFLILKGLAAREGQFANQDDRDDSLADLEGFAGSIRNMKPSKLIDNTSVTQTQNKKTGLQQHLSASCGIASATVIRAEADPVEALALHESQELSSKNIYGNITKQEKDVLNRNSGPEGGPTRKALVRDFVDILGEILNVINKLKSDHPDDNDLIQQFNELSLVISTTGDDTKVQCQRALSLIYQNSRLTKESLDMLLETRKAQKTNPLFPEQGLSNEGIKNEMNHGLNVNKVTGTDVDLQATDLNQAAKRLESGQDVVVTVGFNAQDGHAMTFTNVRTTSNGREFLVHDPWHGKTKWIAESDIKQGRWPGLLDNQASLSQLIY